MAVSFIKVILSLNSQDPVSFQYHFNYIVNATTPD